MNAESAAGPGDTEPKTNVSETNAGEGGGQRSEVRGQRSEGDGEAAGEVVKTTPVGELLSLLEDDGDLTPGMRQEVEQSHEQQQKSIRRTSERGSEQAGESGGAEGDGAGEEGEIGGQTSEVKGRKSEAGGGGAKAKPGAVGEEEEQPLTEEETKQWPKEALGRIHKSTKQRNEAREETKKEREVRIAAEKKVGALEERVKTFKPVVVQPTARNPFANVSDLRQLEGAEKSWKELLDFAELNPDGAEDVLRGTDKEGKEIRSDYSKQQVAEMKVEARHRLEAILARRDLILAQLQSEEQARAAWPEMFDPERPESEIMQKFLQQLPALLDVPDYHIWLGHTIDGFKLHLDRSREAAAKNGKNGKPAAESTSKSEPFTRKHPAAALAPAIADTPGIQKSEVRGQKSDSLQKAEQEMVESLGDEDATLRYMETLEKETSRESAAAVV